MRITRILITNVLVGSALSAGGVHIGAYQSPAFQGPNYDYKSLAVESILDSAYQARKITDVEQRVSVFLTAAQVLPLSKRNEAIGLLDIALSDIRDWDSDKSTSWGQHHAAAKLRSEILALYVKLDPEKASLVEKDSRSEGTSGSPKTGSAASSLSDSNWSRRLLDAQTVAEGFAKPALSLIDTDPEKACALIDQSIVTGAFAGSLSGLFQKLEQDGNRKALDKIELAMIPALRSTVTLDFFSFAYASSALRSDEGMSQTAKAAFIFFLMNSVETWAGLITSQDQNGVVDPSYIGSSFTSVFLNLRPAIAQYSPQDLLRLDVLLARVSPFVPEKTKSRLQAFQPETLLEPRDRLNDILKDPNTEKRDLRLIRLVAELLRNDSADSQSGLDLASDAISAFSDPDLKSAFTDLLTITRMNLYTKQKKFIEAEQKASLISSDETQAWALLALATAAAKSDRVLGFQFISNGLQRLDKTSPSPRKAELALIATAMLAKDDSQRAFDTLSVASRYANSSVSKVDPPAKPPVAFGLDANIGEAHTKLGVFPENLGDIQIDPSLSTLGTTDWFRANQIADGIREPALRLRLKLEFARAMIAEGPKPTKKATTKKPSTKE